MSDNPVPLSVDFFHLDPALADELENTFPEADLVTAQGFSGKEVLSLLVDTSATVIRHLAELFQRWKNSGREVSGRIGEIEFSIKGFDATDAAQMAEEVRSLIREARA